MRNFACVMTQAVLCYVRGNFKINSDMNIMNLISLSDNEMEELENSVYDIVCVRDIGKS